MYILYNMYYIFSHVPTHTLPSCWFCSSGEPRVGYANVCIHTNVETQTNLHVSTILGAAIDMSELYGPQLELKPAC